jgi:chemotaxis protein methyltransferase CheR
MLSHKWDYVQFKTVFYKKTGLNLDSYKDRQMERRIKQFIDREKKSDFQSFYKYLIETPPALERFMNYLTINTSEFFRDGKVYTKLQEKIFPELIKMKPSFFTIWSAGCSIGAEPYTVAIILDLLNVLGRARIIATDIDKKILQVAEKGTFNAKQLGKTKEEIINKYFTEEDLDYHIKPKIKKAVTFKLHNLLSDPPLPNCRMILCRNVFIYFKQSIQAFLLDRFSKTLEDDGFLVIGSAEYINDPGKYGLVKHFNTIYRKKTLSN